jgi:cell wall-associated NlpC family hydrolase
MKKFIWLLSAILIVASFLTISAFAADDVSTLAKVGIVNTDSGLNLRSSPLSSASILKTASGGDAVIVIGQDNGWYKVIYDYTEGYMFGTYLDVRTEADIENLNAIVTGSVVNFRTTPGTNSSVICQIVKGVSVEVVGVKDGWYKISYQDKTGYICADYITLKETVSASSSSPASTYSSGLDTASPTRQSIVEYALKYTGYKYTYGGRSPGTGFDCSGFVYYVFKNFGYTLNPGASNQMKCVASISKSELAPGDLVFFNNGSASLASHVGIYIGDGKFVHAVSPGKSVAVTSLSESHYTRYYVGSGRVCS